MKIKTLHKKLEEIIRTGGGNRNICIDKSSFNHPLESDGCVILQVEDFKFKCHNMIDDDGGTKVNKDGSEVYRTSFVLYGEKQCKDVGAQK